MAVVVREPVGVDIGVIETPPNNSLCNDVRIFWNKIDDPHLQLLRNDARGENNYLSLCLPALTKYFFIDRLDLLGLM